MIVSPRFAGRKSHPKPVKAAASRVPATLLPSTLSIPLLTESLLPDEVNVAADPADQLVLGSMPAADPVESIATAPAQEASALSMPPEMAPMMAHASEPEVRSADSSSEAEADSDEEIITISKNDCDAMARAELGASIERAEDATQQRLRYGDRFYWLGRGTDYVLDRAQRLASRTGEALTDRLIDGLRRSLNYLEARKTAKPEPAGRVRSASSTRGGD